MHTTQISRRVSDVAKTGSGVKDSRLVSGITSACGQSSTLAQTQMENIKHGWMASKCYPERISVIGTIRSLTFLDHISPHMLEAVACQCSHPIRINTSGLTISSHGSEEGQVHVD